MRFIFTISAFALILIGCSQDFYYKKGIADSYQLADSKVDTSLTLVAETNKTLQWKDTLGGHYVQVITWKDSSTIKYCTNDPKTGFYNTKSYPLFVTVAPDLRSWYQKNHPRKSKLRLKQLLGLPPTISKSHFIVFWVRAEDLIRPCNNPYVNACKCSCGKPTDTSNLEYLTWFSNYTKGSFADTTNPMKNFPFTRLGYTYDWNRSNKKHIGLSEFVVPANKNVIVAGVYKTADYFKH